MKSDSGSVELSRSETAVRFDELDSSVYSSMAPLPTKGEPSNTSFKEAPATFKEKSAECFRTVGKVTLSHTAFLSVLLYYIALLMGAAAIAGNRWAGVKNAYISDHIVRKTGTFWGMFSLEYEESLRFEDAMLYAGGYIPYTTIMENEFCTAFPTSNIPAYTFSDAGTLLKKASEVRMFDTGDVRVSNKHHNDAFFDVSCLVIPQLMETAKYLATFVWLSLALFLPLGYFVITRCIGKSVSMRPGAQRVMEMIAAYFWVISLVFGVAALASYEALPVKTGCFDAAGNVVPCAMASSTVFFIVYVCLSALSFISYLAFGMALRREALQESTPSAGCVVSVRTE